MKNSKDKLISIYFMVFVLSVVYTAIVIGNLYNEMDFIAIMDHIQLGKPLTWVQEKRYDFDGDGVITVIDATMLRQKLDKIERRK